MHIIEQPWDSEMKFCRMISDFIKENFTKDGCDVEELFSPTVIFGYRMKGCVQCFFDARENIEAVLVGYPTGHKDENPYGNKIVYVKGGQYFYVVMLALAKHVRGRYLESMKPFVLDVLGRRYPEVNWVIAHRGKNSKKFIKDIRSLIGKPLIVKAAA